MIGIYPYSAVTKKQSKAIEELGFKYAYYTDYNLIKMGLECIFRWLIMREMLLFAKIKFFFIS